MMAWWLVNPGFSPDSPYFWRPPTNVYETAEGLLVQVEVAGLSAGDYRVVLQPSRLQVTGVRRASPVPRDLSACFKVEINCGSFCSETDLPWPVDRGDVRAHYRDGFIFVELRRRREGLP